MVRNIALVIAVMAMGCTSGGAAGKGDDFPIHAIAGTNWQLARMKVDARQTAPIGQSLVSLSCTAEGEVSGSASVNRYSGSMVAEGNRIIRWNPFRMTRMAGPSELMAQESRFMEALQQTTRFYSFENKLVFENRARGIRLKFVQRPESM